jgi:hypothetical protein
MIGMEFLDRRWKVVEIGRLVCINHPTAAEQAFNSALVADDIFGGFAA